MNFSPFHIKQQSIFKKCLIIFAVCGSTQDRKPVTTIFFFLAYTDYQVSHRMMFTFYQAPPRPHDRQNIMKSITLLVYKEKQNELRYNNIIFKKIILVNILHSVKSLI